MNRSLAPAPCDTTVAVSPYHNEGAEWDDFVRHAPTGTFFHLSRWKDIIEESFGFKARYLIARRAGLVVGVLPLVELRSVVGRRSLLSLPFAVEGGVCAIDPEGQRALELAALDLGRDIGATSVELRDGLSSPEFQIREGLYFRFRRSLRPTEEENMAAIPRKQRRMVRLGQRHGLVARVEAADVRVVHDLYARTVRRLGTPVFARAYFRLLLQSFPDQCVILTVYSGALPVAAVLSFVFRDTIMPYYAGSRREYFPQAVNDVMYWELMRYAAGIGLRRFDFGRSKVGTGAFDFKRHWGFAAEPLRYRVHAGAGETPAAHSIDAGGVRLLRWGWSHLPLGITKLLGPALVRRFGPLYT